MSKMFSIKLEAMRVLLFLLVTLVVLTDKQAVASGAEGGENEGFELEEPGVAVLFPWFTIAIGSLAYFIITRFAGFLPYTAVMFVIGTIMGVSNSRLESENHLHESIAEYWREIDAEVLLLCFLPGLIFKDAWSLDANLFQKAFLQMLNFAFPMVLGGTCLAALTAYYILPQDDWSWNFCMVFGSILSATDPVAVAALLEAVGAPPRLKVHVSGEALMNDGAAIVFFTIFSDRYLVELGVNGLGEDVDWGAGVAMFFRMSLGGAAVGIVFGFATIAVMHYMRRRLAREENVVEVSTALAASYLCFYTAELVLHTSGVIATLSMGLVMNEFGKSSINDIKLFKDVWSIVEHLLNTVLFTLGGLVWGTVISNSDNPDQSSSYFTSTDWGYLFLLYILLHVIRGFLFGIFYPATVRLGLGTNLAEQGFQVFGGLRGAVGIALAIALDNTVQQATSQAELEPQFIEQTSKLFGYVGGIAFLTLVINATLSGPLLLKLGLADMTSFRSNILGVVGSRMRLVAIDKLVALLSKPWFASVDYTILVDHINLLQDVYLHEVIASAKRYENVNHQRTWYRPPKLSVIVPHLKVDALKSAMSSEEERAMIAELTKPRDGRRIRQNTHHGLFRSSQLPKSNRFRQSSYQQTTTNQGDDTGMGRRMKQLSNLAGFFGQPTSLRDPADPNTVEESRRLFLEVLRAEYGRLVNNGNLARREDVNYVLMTSIDFAADAANKGGVLNDWEYVRKFKGIGFSWKNFSNTKFIKGFTNQFIKDEAAKARERSVHVEVNLAIAFLEAHTRARRVFAEEFAETEGDLSAAEAQVLRESREECDAVELFLSSLPQEKVRVYVSHIFATILINKIVKHIEWLGESSFLKESEAEEFLEHLQEELFHVEHCSAHFASRRRTSRGTITELKDPVTEKDFAEIEAAIVAEEGKTSRGTSPDLKDLAPETDFAEIKAAIVEEEGDVHET